MPTSTVGPVGAWTDGRGFRNAGAGELIPTWQQGQEAVNPYDIPRFLTQGYGLDSLVYSCITEKATSFAPLRAHIVRQAQGSAAVREHRMIQLLDDPNTEQDASEFQEQIATQFDGAANVYIHKVRVSADPARRERFAGFPVQELQAIRPDYVKIVPGATRAQDVFEVWIEGRRRDSIARRDMIHIHEPKIINDFYGLPKLAVLRREVSIDLEMSDFTLAFFRNAGVPMGLLSLKGRHKPEEVDEIKQRFRRSYNGWGGRAAAAVRTWWDLLVLNADEAHYEKMGAGLSELESDSARGHVESRICSVFGVPPVIVGARFAMGQGSAEQSREEAQHGFWSETMVPFSGRFASAWTKHLLPEFATRLDRRAHVEYDTTVVRALQEDRSRKLREAVRLINTGGVTVAEAFKTVGLPPPANSDFYVRSGNQVTVAADGVTVILDPNADSGETPANPDNPLEGAG